MHTYQQIISKTCVCANLPDSSVSWYEATTSTMEEPDPIGIKKKRKDDPEHLNDFIIKLQEENRQMKKTLDKLLKDNELLQAKVASFETKFESYDEDKEEVYNDDDITHENAMVCGENITPNAATDEQFPTVVESFRLATKRKANGSKSVERVTAPAMTENCTKTLPSTSAKSSTALKQNTKKTTSLPNPMRKDSKSITTYDINIKLVLNSIRHSLGHNNFIVKIKKKCNRFKSL